MAGLGVGITWLGHATVLYVSPKGKRVLVDAWVDGNPACPPESKDLGSLDLMLITHAHSDHFADVVPLAKRYAPDVVCNFETSLWLGRHGVGKTHGMNKGGTLALHGIRVTMVQAIHSNSIQEGDQILPAGEPCGYVLEFENGTRVYHAGDTCIFGDMRLIAELYQPAIAALPIGDHFTMSPHEAAAAAKLLGVRTVVPIHHSTFPVLTGTPADLRKLLADRKDIAVLELAPGQTAS